MCDINDVCTKAIEYLISIGGLGGDRSSKQITLYKNVKDDPSLLTTNVSFEHGYDVDLNMSHTRYDLYALTGYFRIEVKPTVGDDYPTVLRQMRINQKEGGWIDVLLIGKFESESINIDQLRGIFGRYKIVLLSEIEEKLQTYK